MSAREAARRRGGLRHIGPAVAALVRGLRERTDDERVELRLTAAAAEAIARSDARGEASLQGHRVHLARDGVDAPVRVPRATALAWHAATWRAARAGTLPVADAQALSEQLQEPGAA